MYTGASALLLRTAVESFWNSYYELPDPFDGLFVRTQSTQETDTNAWLGAAPMPTQWEGSADVKVANEYSQATKNLAWKSAVRVPKNLIKFQQWDEIGNLTSNLGAKARAHQISKLSAMLDAGAATASVDTQFFFDTDHTWPGAEYTDSQDNDLTAVAASASGLTPTDVEFATAVRAMKQQFYTFKDDRGDPMVPMSDSAENFVLMVPPEYHSLANRVQVADSLTGPVANDLRGTFTVRTNPYLHAADATSGEFYMLYAGSNHKPLVLQEAGGLEIGNNIGGDELRMHGSAVFDASWWGQTKYGQWATAVMYQFTAS